MAKKVEEVSIEQIEAQDTSIQMAANKIADDISKETGKVLGEGEKVSIKIPIDKFNPHDDVIPVCINGYNYFIKRGERVKVPAEVAAILENAGYI